MRYLNKNNAILYLLLVLASFNAHSVFSQLKISVIASPFKILAKDSIYDAYKDLRYKLPRFICEGVFYNSSLTLGKIVESYNGKWQIINPRFEVNDTVFNSGDNNDIKRLLDSLHAKYFINGELYISNGQFRLEVNVIDSEKRSFVYQSYYKSLSADFLNTIDEACQSINYQINLKQTGHLRRIVEVEDFQIKFENKAYAIYQNDIYSPDFPSRYLAYNFTNSPYYSVLPYKSKPDENELGAKDSDKIERQNIILIKGSVTFTNDGNCIIHPVLFTESDSIPALDVKNLIQNKDELLSRTLENVQSILDLVINCGSVDSVKSFLASYSKSGYIDAFNLTLKDNNIAKANFLIDQFKLSGKDTNGESLLLEGKLSCAKNDFKTALLRLKEFLKKNQINPEANYYIGLCYFKLGHYIEGNSSFDSVLKDSITYRDLHFYKGLCSYYQNSFEKAISEFQKQIAFDYKIRPETYTYLGLSFKNQSDWKNAELNLLSIYQLDSLNYFNRINLSNLYNDMADDKYNHSLFDTSFVYYEKSYQISKSFFSLLGEVKNIIKLKQPENILSDLIKKGIQDSVFNQQTIYYYLATYCRTQVDTNHAFDKDFLRAAIGFINQYMQTTNSKSAQVFQDLGSTYFRLNMFDSAEYYYKITLNMKQQEVDYLNLAEAQLMMLRPFNSVKTLDTMDQRFHLSSVMALPSYEPDYFKLLYYFYKIEGMILQHLNYSKEQSQLNKIVNKYSNDKTHSLFAIWSFKTYYFWLIKETKIEKGVKQKLLENLCTLLQYTDDNNLPCLAH
jgi:tetratricopeptide (TPR) repeat protein